MQKIPITTGIIGHRDAVITEAHRQVIKRIFLDLLKKYPHSPLMLFSQLAPGADTVVAELFLEIKAETNRDMQLIASIPFDKAAYIHTQFTTETEKENFEKLVSQSERFFVINPLPERLKKAVKKGKHPEGINEYYRKGAEFVADSSIVLLALWDETDNQLEGGTANTIRYKKTGSYKNFITNEIFDKDGQLIIIPCNRPGQDKQIHLKQNYLKDLLEDESIRKTLDIIERINSENNEEQKENIKQSADWLFPENKLQTSFRKKLRDYYASADWQALKYQKKYLFVLKLLFILGFVFFIAFESYKHLGLIPEVFVLTLSLLGIAYGIYKKSYQSHHHIKYIEARVLAEALRIQFFWNLAKMPVRASDKILRLHKKEYHWLKHLLKAIYGLTYPDKNTPEINTELLKEHWIKNQVEYFKRKINEIEQKEQYYHITSYIIFILAIVILIIIYFLNKKEIKEHYIHILIVLDSILFGLFAIIKAYFMKRGYEEIKAQYKLMADVYKASLKKIDELDTYKEISDWDYKKIFELTGTDALIENGNWYMIYKEKHPEVEGLG